VIAPTLATFVLVFLRAFQQKNVTGHHYLSAALTSFAMAGAEVTLMLQIVEHTYQTIPWIGLGGAMGVTAAMAIHGRVFRK